MCVSIDISTSILAPNINVTSLSAKSSIEEKKKKKKEKRKEEDSTLETKTIFFVILIFYICNIRWKTVKFDADMDIDIILGANMNPRVSNETHVTNEKSLTLTLN